MFPFLRLSGLGLALIGNNFETYALRFIHTLLWQPIFPMLITRVYGIKEDHMQGSLLYQCILKQLKVSLGEGLNSPHPNCPLTITYLLENIPVLVNTVRGN